MCPMCLGHGTTHKMWDRPEQLSECSGCGGAGSLAAFWRQQDIEFNAAKKAGDPGLAELAYIDVDTGKFVADDPGERCGARLSNCVCGLLAHPSTVAHECQDPDPQCGGSWFDHPSDPDLVLVVRWPGLRGNPLAIEHAAKLGMADPPPGAPVEEPRDPAPYRVRMPRGPIKFLPPPGVGAYANDAVFARFPSGTDPLLAIRAAMKVFMERVDEPDRRTDPVLPDWYKPEIES